MSEQVTIIGAGLAGSLLGLYLAQRGLSVEVFEKRPDIRSEQAVGRSGGEGRSINLALSTRGIHALHEVGLATQLTEIMIPLKGRMIHPVQGDLYFAPYGRNDSEVINSISRNSLNSLLLDALCRQKNSKVHFGMRCTGYNYLSSELHLINDSTGETHKLLRTPVIGTDGSASAIRTSMLGQGRFNFSQSYLDHSYKELTIAASSRDEFQMDSSALHIWPRGGYMMIALPNIDKSFTCTLFFPHTGALSFESLRSPDQLLSFYKSQFPDAVPLLGDLSAQFFKNPTGNLITIKCGPWNVGGQTLLLGDAAHAIVPFYGQGMNSAFEDCTILLDRYTTFGARVDWAALFDAFSQERKVDADAIADLALDNFIEMRDTSANPKFVMKKHLEHHLEDKFPGQFISKYSMVSFHRVPYSMAMKKGRIQDTILMEECERANSIDEIDLNRVFQRISRALNEPRI